MKLASFDRMYRVHSKITQMHRESQILNMQIIQGVSEINVIIVKIIFLQDTVHSASISDQKKVNFTWK